MIIRKYTEKDISEMVHIWNEVVEDGEALVLGKHKLMFVFAPMQVF